MFRLAPKTAHAEMTALLDVYTRNFRAMNNYSIQTSEQAVIYLRASETPERFSKVWTKWSGVGIQFHSDKGESAQKDQSDDKHGCESHS